MRIIYLVVEEQARFGTITYYKAYDTREEALAHCRKAASEEGNDWVEVGNAYGNPLWHSDCTCHRGTTDRDWMKIREVEYQIAGRGDNA